MAVTLYRWTDASAPTLTGQAGSLITVLSACLVTGYGSKPAAGWTIPSLGGSNPGTNVIAYLQGSGSNGYYVRVNNSGTRVGTTHEAVGTPGTNIARVRGYETMTSLTDSGTNLFPTVAQQASGLFARTSATTDAVTRPWFVVADQRTFYVFVISGDVISGNNIYQAWGFGEFYSYKTSDSGRTFIAARDAESSFTLAANDFLDKGTTVANTMTGFYLARDATGAVGAVTAGKHPHFGFQGIQNNIQGIVPQSPNTNPGDNRTYLFPLRITHTSGGNTIRGRMRGLWSYGHLTSTISDMDTITGIGDYTGRTFLIFKFTPSQTVYCIETSNTWDTN